jgi:putative hydrolase of the HAD superfamily
MTADPDMERQHLIIDADDTLWENNIYFEQAFDRFCALLDHSTLTPGEVREALDGIEAANNKVHGYGAHNFVRNLRECYELLMEREPQASHFEEIASYAHHIMGMPIELMPGVEETVPDLAARHELTIFTKGNYEEQSAKIARSGIGKYFTHREIVKEKNRGAYCDLIARLGFDAGRAWMIGNSPKSDINPALAAGLRAVYVPHDRTWSLEREEMQSSQKLLVAEGFSDLRRIFL